MPPDRRRREASTGGSFHSAGAALPFTRLDFWQWAANDLVGNTLRGWVAEFLVAQALGVADEPRREWDVVDLRTRDGRTVEVKSAAYRQSWQQKRDSVIRYGIAPHAKWDAATNEYDLEKRRWADVYVFALLAHRDEETLDPMDVAQWKFRCVASSLLDAELGGQKSVGLGTLKGLGAREVGFGELAGEVEEVLRGDSSR